MCRGASFGRWLGEGGCSVVMGKIDTTRPPGVRRGTWSCSAALRDFCKEQINAAIVFRFINQGGAVCVCAGGGGDACVWVCVCMCMCMDDKCLHLLSTPTMARGTAALHCHVWHGAWPRHTPHLGTEH